MQSVHLLELGENPTKERSLSKVLLLSFSLSGRENGALYGKPILIKVSFSAPPSLSLEDAVEHARSMETYNWKVIKLK